VKNWTAVLMKKSSLLNLLIILANHTHAIGCSLMQRCKQSIMSIMRQLSFHSPFSVQTRGSVTGDITYPQSSGLR